MELNYLNIKILKYLPPTDSRLRADIRALERDNVDLALYERKRIEEKIKNKISKYYKDGRKFKPKWFDQRLDINMKNIIYYSNSKYWMDKQKFDYYEDN